MESHFIVNLRYLNKFIFRCLNAVSVCTVYKLILIFNEV